MRKAIQGILLLLWSLTLQGLIVRHDVADKKFIARAKQYPQICHLPMGEATLIGSQWAITAGHIGNDLVNDMHRGFKPTIICQGVSYVIEKVIVHPNFKSIDDGLANDIALIQFKGKITNIVPVKMYEHNDEQGKFITLVGRGDIGNGLTGPERWDKITRAATNRIDGVDTEWVQFTFDSPDSATVTEMEGISGPGDSGGPAIVEIDNEKYLVGISSHQTGQGKNGKGRYGVTEHYTRVSYYKNWIRGELNKK